MKPFLGAVRYFFLIFYYLPLSAMLFVGQPVVHRHVDTNWLFASLFYVFLAHLLFEFICFFLYSLNRRPSALFVLHRICFSDAFKTTIVLVYLAVVLHMVQNYGINIRQGEDRISDIGIMAMLLFALRPVLFFHVLEDAMFPTQSKHKLRKWLYVICIAIYPIAAFDIFYALLLIFLPLLLRVKRLRLTFTAKVIVFGTLLCVATVFFGLANKIGQEEAYERIVVQRDNEIGSYLFTRVSVFAQSVNVSLADTWEGTRDPFEGISVCKDACLYRLSVITRLFEFPRPDITSINRLNFLRLYFYDRISEPGTTPGFLGLPFFLPAWYMSCVVVLIFVALLSYSLDFRFRQLREDGVKWWIISLMIVPILFQFLLNPIDLILSVGPPQIVLLMILSFSGGPMASCTRRNIQQATSLLSNSEARRDIATA